MTVQYSDAELLYQCDLYNPSTGTIRYVAMLSSALQLGIGFTANAATNAIAFTTAQPFQTGARVHVSSTGTLPTPLVAGLDYFVIRLTSTTFTLAATVGVAIAAVAGTEVDLMDAGSGVLTVNEQPLLRTDPIAVLLSKEFASAPGYTTRFPITDVGPSTIVLAKAQKSKLIVISNSGSVDMAIGYYLLIRGGSNTIADTTIAGYGLEILANPLTVVAGETKGLNLIMRGA